MKLSLAVVLAATSSLAAASTPAPPHGGPGRVVVTDTTCVILGPILFKADDAHLLPSHLPMIKAVAQTLRDNPSIAVIEVEGFADAHEANPELLGLARATAIMAALVAEGVPLHRLRAGSLGETQPLADSAQHPEKNRRIEFLIVRRDG